MGCGSSSGRIQVVHAVAVDGQYQNGNVQQKKASDSSQGQNGVENHQNSADADGSNQQIEPRNTTTPVQETLATPGKDVPTYTKETLEDFLSLQKKLGELQNKNITGQYQTQHKMLVVLYKNLQEAQKKVDGLKQQTAKEYQDVAYMQHPNVRAMFSNTYQLQSQMAKEQQEYMDALNRQEVAEKELSGIQQEYKALYTEVDVLQKEYEELEKLKNEEEKMLTEIFGGKYGSDLEEQLEDQTELLLDRKELITSTRNRWHNAKILLDHAVNQLQYSTRRWAQINTVSQELVQARYSMVAETRNYLIAASQNIANSHRYLGNVQIPYCNSDDLKILNNSIGSIFNDIMTRDLYIRALQTYQTLYTRCSHLLQWVIMVLEKTINEDLKKIVPEYYRKLSELKRERLRLINVKLRELDGNVAEHDDITVPEDNDIIVPEDDDPVVVPSDTHIAQPDTVSLKEEVENKEDVAPPPTTEDETEEALVVTETPEPTEKAKETENQPTSVSPTEKPKPLTDLAPVPSMDTLFGNIEELKTKYEQQILEFSKAQDVNKARVDQALEEKLRARKTRKIKIELDNLDAKDLEKGFKKLSGIF